MLLYSSESLQISFEQGYDRCTLNWISSPRSKDEFKKDILNYREIAITYKMKQAIWLQQKLNILMDEELTVWLEQNMNEPIIKDFKTRNYYPLDKDSFYPVALVLGTQAYNLYTLSQINEHSEDTSLGKRKPKVFAEKQEATLWLDNWKPAKEVIAPKSNNKINIDHVLKNYFLEQVNFIDHHQNSFDHITNREKEIIIYLLQGKSLVEVASVLFISVHTVRTHWKNIKKKMGIKSILDITTHHNVLH